MSKPPVSEQVQVNFRMPVDLRDRIKAAAEANNRSMNAEIVSRLDDSLFSDYPPDAKAIQAIADAVIRRIAEFAPEETLSQTVESMQAVKSTMDAPQK